MILLKKSFREFLQHKLAYVFLIMILALGLGASVGVKSFMATRENIFDKMYEQSRFMELEADLLYNETLTSEGISKALSEIPNTNLKAYESRLIFEVVVNKDIDQPELIRGKIIGYDVGESKTFNDIKVNRPLFYESEYTDISKNKDSVYLEKSFSKFYEYDKGDVIYISREGSTYGLEISEHISIPKYFVVQEESDMLATEATLGIIASPIELANTIFGNQNEHVFNNFVFKFKDNSIEEIKTFEKNLTEHFQSEGIQINTTLAEDNPARQVIINDLDNDREFMGMYPAIFYFIASLGLFVVMKRTIDTKKTEIGLYKALGVKSRVIIIFYTITALILSFFSIIAGLVLGLLFNDLFYNMLNGYYNFAVSDRIFDYDSIWEGILIVSGITLASVLLPTWAAIRMPTIDALQKREGIDRISTNGLSKFLKKLKFLPASIRLSAKYLFRNPFRSLTTSLGIILSATLFLGVYLMIDSFRVILDHSKNVDNWDYELQLNGFQSDETLDLAVSDIDIVPALNLPIEIKVESKDQKNVSALVYAPEKESMKDLFGLKYQNGLASDNGLIISEYISKEFKINIGDKITVQIPELSATNTIQYINKTVQVRDIHDFPLGTFVYMDLDEFQSLTKFFGNYNFAYLMGDENVNSSELMSKVLDSGSVTSVVTQEQKEKQFDRIFESIVSVTYAMLIISFLMALSIVYNMYTLNVNDRIRDYSTMRTLGTSMSRISKLLGVETLIVTAIGLLVSALTSILFAAAVLKQTEDTFGEVIFETRFSSTGFFMTAAMIAVSMLIVFLTVLRKIAKLDLASMLKYRAN